MSDLAGKSSSQSGEAMTTQKPEVGGEQGLPRRPTLQVNDVVMPSSSRDETSQTTINTMSPELLAQITETIRKETERMKKEVVEHLKQQTSGVEQVSVDAPKPADIIIPTELPKPVELSKTEPMQRDSSKSTSASSPPPPGRGAYTPPSPDKLPPRAPDSPPLSPILSRPESPTKERPSVRFSNPRRMSDYSTRTARPSNGERTYSNAELSVIDQKWGRLFDSDKMPTPRLGQFLRGLANHIIEDFAPKKSIVITPEKLVAFYTTFSLEKEIHPMTSIFKVQSNEQISQLYLDLGCQHHLIQEDVRRVPKIPGLTPLGFSQWLTITILAYPEQEACRLEKVVQTLPIDADGGTVDGKPERLPKQISRHLLPGSEDKNYRQLLDEAISDFWDDLNPKWRKGSGSSPPLSRRTSTSQSKPSSKPIDRERMVYGSPPSDASALNDSTRIERERKPYVAQPGGGKIHDISSNVPTSTRGRASSINQGSRDADFGERHTRAQSNASNASNPAYIPSQRSAGGRRPSSPPLQKFSSSVPSNIDGPNITYIAPSFSTAAQNYTPVSQPIEMRDRDWDYRDRDVRDRDRDEDLRRYGKDGRRNTMDDSRTNELNNLRDSRRSTFDDARTADTMSQRDVDRWDRGQEGRGAEQRNSRDHDDYYRGNGR